MAKGTDEKLIVLNRIKEIFPNSFEYDKVLRIPIGDVQIKVSLTCAKDNVEVGGSSDSTGPVWTPGGGADEFVEAKPSLAPTEEEINDLALLMSELNI